MDSGVFVSKKKADAEKWLSVIERESGYVDIAKHTSQQAALDFVAECGLSSDDNAYVAQLTHTVTVALRSIITKV